MGHSETQMAEFRTTLERTDADIALAATPIHLG